MGRRLTLDSLTPAQRISLANMMSDYITDDVVDLHPTFIHSGEMLFIHHRGYIEGMEEYLAANGGEEFVPLPKWDPATPIPAEFNVVVPQDDSTPRPPLVNLNPNMPLAPEYRPPALCSFSSGEDLGNSINGWHGTVHTTVGGTMGMLAIASAAPIFWCWHGFLDDIYWDWQNCFGAPPESQPRDRYERDEAYMKTYRKYYASRCKEKYKHKEYFRHTHGQMCCCCNSSGSHHGHRDQAGDHHIGKPRDPAMKKSSDKHHHE